MPMLGDIVNDEIFMPKGWVPLHGRDLKKAISLHSGGFYWPLEQRVEEILLEDIIHTLPRKGRFADHTQIPISVANHSCTLASVCEERLSFEHARWALLHDASETYFNDIPTPLKYLPELAAYVAAEEYCQTLIAERFQINLTTEQYTEVHELDRLMAYAEMLVYMPVMAEIKMKAQNYSDELIESAKELSHRVRVITDENYDRARFLSYIEDYDIVG